MIHILLKPFVWLFNLILRPFGGHITEDAAKDILPGIGAGSITYSMNEFVNDMISIAVTVLTAVLVTIATYFARTFAENFRNKLKNKNNANTDRTSN